MLYVLYGPDQFRAREEMRRIREELDKDGNLANNTVRRDAQEARALAAAELRNVCHTASFFAEDRLVIVEGLLSRFSSSRSRRGRSRRGSGEAGGSELDEFLDILNTLPPTTTVVLIDENAPAAFLEGLTEAAKIKKFEALRGEQLRSWAAERIRNQGAIFAAGALDRLLALVDAHHLGELASEIDKLITYAGGRAVEVGDVDDMVSGAVRYQTWDLTDAVIEGRTDKALSVLRRMNAKDQPPQLLAYMLVRQYRQLLLAQAYLREGMSAPQIGSQMGLQGFPLRKIIEQASRYPAERLEQAYRRLLESDVAVKTGVLDADTALEMLIVSLTQLARAPRRGAAARV